MKLGSVATNCSHPRKCSPAGREMFQSLRISFSWSGPLKLVDCRQVNWQDRAHFFRLAAKKMREILVDYARKKRFEKRGGSVKLVSIEEATPVQGKAESPVNLILLSTALDELEAFDPRKTQIVEMRFFAGLSIEEIAQSLGLAVSTIHRELHLAKVWLFRAIQP